MKGFLIVSIVVVHFLLNFVAGVVLAPIALSIASAESKLDQHQIESYEVDLCPVHTASSFGYSVAIYPNDLVVSSEVLCSSTVSNGKFVLMSEPSGLALEYIDSTGTTIQTNKSIYNPSLHSIVFLSISFMFLVVFDTVVVWLLSPIKQASK